MAATPEDVAALRAYVGLPCTRAEHATGAFHRTTGECGRLAAHLSRDPGGAADSADQMRGH